MVEHLTIREALIMTIKKNLQRNILNDSQLTVNTTHDKIFVPRDVINFVTDILNIYLLS